jgi:hypothetical protein
MTSSTQYLQPHEGVQGRDLNEGHLLTLDDASVDRRLELISLTRERYDDILHARIADRDAAFERMYNPRVGDLVMELTTSFRTDRDWQVQASGILLVHERREWACTDEEWARNVEQERVDHEESGIDFDAEQFARDRFADRASYIQYGAASRDICRWANCKFIAVPDDLVRRFTSRAD